MNRKFKAIAVALMLAAGLAGQPAMAQDIGGKHDADQPIEITADSLEVMQQEQMAVFKGNVIATQGKMQITSDVMRVYYRSAEEKQAEAQAVSKIEVEGDVFMATPDESARSRTGVYDVDANLITLREDVVLTRGENVVKGAFLKYDLTSGKSQIAGAEATVDPQTGEASGNKGRVRGLFVPESK